LKQPANVCRLDEPLWPKGPNLRRLTQLCVKATVACERAMREAAARAPSTSLSSSSSSSAANANASATPFDGPGGAQLYRDFERACRGPPLHTLRAVGLLALFPCLEGLATAGAARHQNHYNNHQQQPHQPQHQQQHQHQNNDNQQSSPGWDYFTHVSHLHQLLHMVGTPYTLTPPSSTAKTRVVPRWFQPLHPSSENPVPKLCFQHVPQLLYRYRVSTQLRGDACNPANHKYLAHQIALLYQCLNQVRGESKGFKKRIEAGLHLQSGVFHHAVLALFHAQPVHTVPHVASS
jgi:hypothetical protein